MKAFDRKFGATLLESVPTSPGIYRFYSETDKLIYVGKAKNLRRRLAQYRNAGRRKRDRKMRSIVKSAARLEYEVKATDLDACLEEVRWIQRHRPRWNVATAFSFLYPLIGLHERAGMLLFCFTTVPERFPDYRFHGAFRSRESTGEAFFALMQLLQFAGHKASRKSLGTDSEQKYSYVFGFRRLPASWPELWSAFFKGESAAALEELVLRLVENAGARARAAEVQEGIDTLRSFWKKEARTLFSAIQATAYPVYPVSQEERDLLFLRYRNLESQSP